jgi:hypothetical protein
MKIIDIKSLREMFLEFLDEAKYQLEQEGFNEVSGLQFGSSPSGKVGYSITFSNGATVNCELPVANKVPYIGDDEKWWIGDVELDVPSKIPGSQEPITVLEVHTTNSHDRIFLEAAFYDEAIKQVPNTEEELIIPGLFIYDGADIINDPTYDAYQISMGLEILPFEGQRIDVRRLLERFAVILRGKQLEISYKDNNFTWGDNVDNTGEVYNCIISVEMPQLGPTESQSGYDRFMAYINFDILVLGNITINNTISVSIDNEVIPLTGINIERNKSIKTMNIRSKEAKSYAENQTLSFSIEGLFNRNSEACKKIQKCILESNYLNEPFNFEYDGYSYTMYLQKGTINIQPNVPTTFTAIFSLLQEL